MTVFSLWACASATNAWSASSGGPPAPGATDQTAQTLAAHPQVRFVAATTGPANLLAAVAATDLDALYGLLTGSLDGLEHVRSLEVTSILMTYKRNRLPRLI